MAGIATSTGESREEVQLATKAENAMLAREASYVNTSSKFERSTSRRRSTLGPGNQVLARGSIPRSSSASRRRFSLDPDCERIENLWLDEDID